MNSEQIDSLYEIVSRLKVYKDSRESYKKLQVSAPSHSINERYASVKEEYIKALNDFDYWLENYVKYDKKEIEEVI